MKNLVIALRNLARHRRRTGAALVSIVFGAMALVLAGGFIEWILWGMREATIQGQLGHIQVVRAGYPEYGQAQPFEYLLAPDGQLETLLAGHPEVEVATPRLAFSGLVSHGDHTVPFAGEGVDPVREARVSVDYRIRQGVTLAREGPEVILGLGLASTLDAGPGDTVALLVTTAGGGYNAVEVQVSGVFATASKAVNDVTLRIPIGVARQLMRVEGHHGWILLLRETMRTDAVRAELSQMLEDDALELIPWHVRADFYNKSERLLSSQMKVMQGIIAVIILLGISNTLMMNVMERTGEIGTQLALGFRRASIVRQFLAEGLLLGLLGGALGLALGVVAALALSAVGIPMPPAPGMDTGFVAEIRLTLPLLLTTLALAAGTTVVAGLYPAWKASRLPIVDALRHNR